MANGKPGSGDRAKIIRQEHSAIATIADTEADSNAVDLRGLVELGLIPPTLTNCTLTFLVSLDGESNWSVVRDLDGAAVTIVAGLGNFAISTDDLAVICGYPWVRIRSSAAQGAERQFIFTMKG